MSRHPFWSTSLLANNINASKIPTSGCSRGQGCFPHTIPPEKAPANPAHGSTPCYYKLGSELQLLLSLSLSLSLSLLARSRILRVPVLETFQRQAGVIEGDRFPSLYSNSSENFLAQTCVWSLAPFLSTLSRSVTHPSHRPQRWKPLQILGVNNNDLDLRLKSASFHHRHVKAKI